MSVLGNRGQSKGCRLSLLLLVLGSVVLGSSPGAVLWAQEEIGVADTAESTQESALWSRVTERYQVVVLSRGLLLEPLDAGVELVTIEVIDDRVAIDGESVDEDTLREQIGDEAADVVLELAAMERGARRRLFEQGAKPEEAVLAEAEEAEAEAAAVADEESDRRKYSDSQVSVGNSLTVREDEVAREALVFGGPLYVHGKVAGDAVAVGGSVTVSGEVTGDVAAVGGDVTLKEGAEVLGDVVSVGGEVDIDDRASVRGQIIEVPFGPNLQFGAWPRVLFGRAHAWDGDDYTFDLSPWGVATEFMWEAFKFIVLALLVCLIMLISRQPLERVRRRAMAEPWKSGLIGLLVQILTAPMLVLLILILVISIIGIPLLLLVPFIILALVLVAFLGFTGVAYGVGELLKRRFGWKLDSPYLVLLLGVASIQVWSMIADLLDFGWGPIWFFAVMFGVFGILVKYAAWTIGLGAAVMSRFGTADSWGGQGAAHQPPTPPEPTYDRPAEPPDPREPSVLRDLDFMEDSRSVDETGFDRTESPPEPPSTREP